MIPVCHLPPPPLTGAWPTTRSVGETNLRTEIVRKIHNDMVNAHPFRGDLHKAMPAGATRGARIP